MSISATKSDISKVRQGIVQLKYRADGFKFQPNKYNQMAQNISFGFKFLTNAERLKVTKVGKVRHGMISRKVQIYSTDMYKKLAISFTWGFLGAQTALQIHFLN